MQTLTNSRLAAAIETYTSRIKKEQTRKLALIKELRGMGGGMNDDTELVLR